MPHPTLSGGFLALCRLIVLKEAGLTKPTAAHPSGGPVAGGAIGTSGMPLTASGRERPPDSDACKQAPRSWVS